jgi:acid phosphatase
MNFISFGDWGENTPLKNTLTYIIHTLNPDALITLGDNFYPNGVKNNTDPLWESTYEFFFGKFLTFAVLGNHDYMLNPYAQLKYFNPNWVMPNRFYNRMYKDVHLIALDTIELAPNISAAFIPNFKLQPSNQLEWLEYVLKTSTSPWKIVYGHYPIFSNGGHGDTEELKQKLLPLFKKYKVHLYLSGHDHSICHKYYEGTHFVVSGNGSYSNAVKPIPGFTPLKENCGFAYINVTPKQLQFRLVSFSGNVLLNNILKMR